MTRGMLRGVGLSRAALRTSDNSTENLKKNETADQMLCLKTLITSGPDGCLPQCQSYRAEPDV